MPILLKNILRENVENRLNLMRIEALMEKVLEEITEEEAKPISELFTLMKGQRCALNATPYTKFNVTEWMFVVEGVRQTINMLRAEVIALQNTSDCVRALIVALDDSVLLTT